MQTVLIINFERGIQDQVWSTTRISEKNYVSGGMKLGNIANRSLFFRDEYKCDCCAKKLTWADVKGMGEGIFHFCGRCAYLFATSGARNMKEFIYGDTKIS